jgi:AraC-like DNA-binding protein
MREMLREAKRWPLQDDDTPLRQAFFDAMGHFCSEWITAEADLFLPTCHDPRLQRALDFTALQTEARLAEICRHAGLSERTLRRRLKTETGLTWEAFRQRQRLLVAVHLLSETNEPVGAVAARCGFESPSSFAKAFRLMLGETPSQFRARSLS